MPLDHTARGLKPELLENRAGGRIIKEVRAIDPRIAEHLSLVLLALGDALMGAALAKSLGLPRDSARKRAVANLEASMAEYYGTIANG